MSQLERVQHRRVRDLLPKDSQPHLAECVQAGRELSVGEVCNSTSSLEIWPCLWISQRLILICNTDLANDILRKISPALYCFGEFLSFC